jgi:RNA polymerase sigma-70 factor (ECF subfamily)
MIQRALASLSPDHRAVVILKDLEDHRYEDIAAILNISIGTVRSRLHRARCELRRLLSELLIDEQNAKQSQAVP